MPHMNKDRYEFGGRFGAAQHNAKIGLIEYTKAETTLTLLMFAMLILVPDSVYAGIIGTLDRNAAFVLWLVITLSLIVWPLERTVFRDTQSDSDDPYQKPMWE